LNVVRQFQRDKAAFVDEAIFFAHSFQKMAPVLGGFIFGFTLNENAEVEVIVV
jgi:hypothetical protein